MEKKAKAKDCFDLNSLFSLTYISSVSPKAEETWQIMQNIIIKFNKKCQANFRVDKKRTGRGGDKEKEGGCENARKPWNLQHFMQIVLSAFCISHLSHLSKSDGSIFGDRRKFSHDYVQKRAMALGHDYAYQVVVYSAAVFPD